MHLSLPATICHIDTRYSTVLHGSHTIYSMLNTTKDSVSRVAIEYNGLGSQPYFVIDVEGEIKFIPIKRGVTRLTDIIDN